MSFPKAVREEALVNSRRSCCVCHEFAGLYTNVHHIISEASGGSTDIDNAIVLCLRCHGEVGHYNPNHPIGNKYSPEELRRHKEKWCLHCERNPTKSLPTHPISISPNAFRLVAGKWQTKITLKVINRSDEILYDVAVKISVRVSGIEIKDIRIETQKREFELTHEISGYEFVGDVIRLNGKDSADLEACVLYIHSIEPREAVSFIVSNKSKKFPTPQHKQHAVISLLGFSEEPSEMLVQENQAAVKIQSYENWDVAGIEVIIFKKK